MGTDDNYSFTYGIDVSGDGYVRIFQYMLDYYADLGITNTEMMAICHLASYHYESPYSKGARPSLATIARKMGYQDTTSVSRLLNGLAERGWITIRRSAGKPNQYDVAPMVRTAKRMYMVDGLKALDEEGVGENVNPQTLRVDNSAKGPLAKMPTEEEKKEHEGGVEDQYTIHYHYKDHSRVQAEGTRGKGPWSVLCISCGEPVEIPRRDEAFGCLCGMHEYIVLSKQPDAPPKTHPAVALYRKASGCRPTEDQIALIAGTVNPEDLAFWGQVISKYKSLGYNPKSVDTMLRYYERGELPSRKRSKPAPTEDGEHIGQVLEAV